jgi:prophage antirepressor-like protein
MLYRKVTDDNSVGCNEKLLNFCRRNGIEMFIDRKKGIWMKAIDLKKLTMYSSTNIMMGLRFGETSKVSKRNYIELLSDTTGQKSYFINEEGLYQLVSHSKKGTWGKFFVIEEKKN